MKEHVTGSFFLSFFLSFHNIQITNKMHFKVYELFYSQFSHQHVSATVAAIFRVMLLLQEQKVPNMVSCAPNN